MFGYKKSTLTSILDRLESRKLIHRKPHPTDRRSILVCLTRSGKRLAEKTQRPVEELERCIRSGVKASDLRGFERVMSVIGDVTKVEVKPNKEIA